MKLYLKQNNVEYIFRTCHKNSCLKLSFYLSSSLMLMMVTVKVTKNSLLVHIFWLVDSKWKIWLPSHAGHKISLLFLPKIMQSWITKTSWLLCGLHSFAQQLFLIYMWNVFALKHVHCMNTKRPNELQ